MRKVTVGRTEPVAHVTKGKHRLKQYRNDTVYLRNGDEFELELFNPTSDKVMAKIELNGNSLGAGVVLRPGERVFIERYLEEARKFMFQTYEVNGKSEEVKQAIANNGDVKVLFYKESTPYNYPINTTWTTMWPTWGDRTFIDPPVYGYPNTSIVKNNFYGSVSNTMDMSGSLDISNNLDDSVSCFTAQACCDSLDFMPREELKSSVQVNSGRKLGKSMRSAKASKSVETGRIDKGDVSNQSFGHDYSTFETYWTWETTWKILPLSQKPLVSEDIKVFCTNCSTRQKKSSHKFCPNCGTKFL